MHINFRLLLCVGFGEEVMWHWGQWQSKTNIKNIKTLNKTPLHVVECTIHISNNLLFQSAYCTIRFSADHHKIATTTITYRQSSSSSSFFLSFGFYFILYSPTTSIVLCFLFYFILFFSYIFRSGFNIVALLFI